MKVKDFMCSFITTAAVLRAEIHFSPVHQPQIYTTVTSHREHAKSFLTLDLLLPSDVTCRISVTQSRALIKSLARLPACEANPQTDFTSIVP